MNFFDSVISLQIFGKRKKVYQEVFHSQKR